MLLQTIMNPFVNNETLSFSMSKNRLETMLWALLGEVNSFYLSSMAAGDANGTKNHLIVFNQK